MNPCLVCGSADVCALIDFGLQPIGNRFLTASAGDEKRVPVSLVQCGACGLIQIGKPAPADDLRPTWQWITYSEPEEHLDSLVDLLVKTDGVTRRSVFAGLSSKDDSTLERLRAKGFEKVWRVDMERDLGVEGKGAGAESLQAAFTPAAAGRIAGKRGHADVVIARHVLEHSGDLSGFLKALAGLARPGGWIVIEAPDCGRALDLGDCTTVWEEHTAYFTPATFQRALGENGLELVRYASYPYSFENSLVGIARVGGDTRRAPMDAAVLRGELERGRAFAESVEARRKQWRAWLEQKRARGERMALLGAGHLAVTFINVMEVGDLIDFVVDDNPEKKGLYLPGARLPIRSSQSLLEEGIKLCLLGVNPNAEEKVLLRNGAYTSAGGSWASIFPGSRLAPALDAVCR